MCIDKCNYCGVRPASSGWYHDPSCLLYIRPICKASKWSRYADIKMFYELGFGWSSPLNLLNAIIIPTILVPLILFENVPDYNLLIFLVLLVVIDSLFFIKRKHIKTILIGIVIGFIFTLAIIGGFLLAILL